MAINRRAFIMKTVLVWVVGLFATQAPSVYGICDMASVYTELGCSAVYNDNSTDCPIYYTCADLHPDKNKCYYRGIAYNDGDMIPGDRVQNSCSVACTCSVKPTPSFRCATVDCFEQYEAENGICIYTYDLESCCSSGIVCGQDEINKLATCEYGGQVYREGQQFFPTGSRKTCVCSKQWDGKVDDSPHCRDDNCGVEIHNQEKIYQKCAPLFYKDAKKCPIQYLCPSESSVVTRASNIKSSTVGLKCSFGNMTLGVGDQVSVTEKCVTCSCEIPPFVLCIQQEPCAG